MSNEPKDPNDLPAPPQGWAKWMAEVRTATLDHEAVTKDLLRPKRKRNLGVREAKRLYKEARDQLAKLLALGGGRGGGDDGDGGSPAR